MVDGFLTVLPFVLAYWVGYLHAKFQMRKFIRSSCEALSDVEIKLVGIGRQLRESQERLDDFAERFGDSKGEVKSDG